MSGKVDSTFPSGIAANGSQAMSGKVDSTFPSGIASMNLEQSPIQSNWTLL
jgi:hypothetical protein